MQQRIALIDCNNFFVSCERLFRPDLEQQPVLVLSSNDGCVVARSQEVKDIGIPMGVPYFQVKDIIKDNKVQIFSGNITLYRDVSRRVFSLVRQEFVAMEQYSIDEAFVLLPENESAAVVCQSLKDKIRTDVGIPVSIGVAPTKTLAKFAATKAKQQDGVYVLPMQQWKADADTVDLATIWGVGSRLSQRYRESGLRTVGDLLAADTARLAKLYGVQAVRQQAELRGESVHPVKQTRLLQKSLMSSRSFSKVTEDKAVLADAAAYHTRHIAAELRAMGAVAGVLRVSLRTSRHGDFLLRGGSDTAVLPEPTADTFVFMRQVKALLHALYEPDVPYQKIGVTVSEIVPKDSLSGTLFGETPVDNPLLQTIDRLNSKQTKELVVVGSRLKTKQWQSKAALRSGAYTTRWSDVPLVSAG